MSYGFGSNAIDPPPKRFVKKLIEHKKEKLATARPSVEHLFKRDFIIKVHLEGITPEIWRRIRVSGGISLHVLHDKVLGPAIGWVRNYHGYKFTDYRDGACIGAVATNSVDMMHIDKDGKFNLQKFSLFSSFSAISNLSNHIFHIIKQPMVVTINIIIKFSSFSPFSIF